MKRSFAATLAILVGLGMAQWDPSRTRPVSVQTAPAPANPLLAQPPAAPTISAQRAASALVTRPKHRPGETPQHLDSDIPQVPFDLAQTDLDQLIVHGTLVLELPDGERLPLTLRRLDERAGYQLVHVQTRTGPGQFTRSARGFFGTVASTSGVYSIENQGDRTTIARHSELDRRVLPGLNDGQMPADA